MKMYQGTLTLSKIPRKHEPWIEKALRSLGYLILGTLLALVTWFVISATFIIF